VVVVTTRGHPPRANGAVQEVRRELHDAVMRALL
jgi:hypothetical protein